MFKIKHLVKMVAGVSALCFMAINPAKATVSVIVQDGFSGTNGTAIAGTVPDVTNLPGGTWQVDSTTSTGTFTATISTTTGNPSPSLLMNCQGNSSGSAAISLASNGSYTKPTTLTIQADFDVAGMQTGNAPHGAMLGFYTTPPATNTDPITGFTGLVLQEDGSLVLVANGATVSTINYTGTFTAGNFNTLSYTINTTTGAISNVTLTGSTSTYNFSTSGFTNSATAYATVGGRNTFGRDQNAYADNFIVSGGSSGGVLAVAANTFLNSMGINTHISQGVSESSYEALFTYTGIRNDRDGENDASSYVTLHNNTIVSGFPGVLCDIIAEDDTTAISTANTLASGSALLSMEGPNEPNNQTIVYGGQTGGGSGTWVPVADLQAAIYSSVSGSSTLKNYPVFGVSEDGAETNNVGLQYLTIPTPLPTGVLLAAGTQFSNYANCHNYVSNAGLVDNMAWNAANPSTSVSYDGMYGEYTGVTWGQHFAAYPTTDVTIPKVTTETGWGTSGSGSVTQDQQGKVFLNVYLAEYKRGWSYTFIYEMRDNEGGDSTGEGIYTSSSTAKLAATYIHNFTTILQDTVSNAPGSLNYTIPSEPATVHDLLLQKSNGTYYLVIWDDRPVGEANDNVTVNLGGTYSVNKYDPTVGTSATSLGSVSSVALTLSDHPIILAVP